VTCTSTGRQNVKPALLIPILFQEIYNPKNVSVEGSTAASVAGIVQDLHAIVSPPPLFVREFTGLTLGWI
jgi:hypothetical protein